MSIISIIGKRLHRETIYQLFFGIITIIDKPRKGENPSGALKTYGSGKDF